MKDHQYIEVFKTFLEERGYRNHYQVKYNDNGVCRLSYWYVDVMNTENDIIQVFVLMNESLRTRCNKYPIWESYEYISSKIGFRVYPAVFIATLEDNGKWSAYSASNTSVAKDSDSIINYEKACERFDRRVEVIERYDKMVKTIKWISWSFAILLIIYLIAHIITSTLRGFPLPLTSQMVLLSGLIIILILLPIVFPYIKSVSLNGIDLFLKGD